MVVRKVADEYVLFEQNKRAYRKLRKAFRESPTDFWQQLFRAELMSFLTASPVNLAVVRWFHARPDETIRSLVRSLRLTDYWITADGIDSRLGYSLMMGFSDYPDNSVIILETRKPIIVAYTKKELKEALSFRTKRVKWDEWWEHTDKLRAVKAIPMVLPKRKVIVISRRGEVEAITPVTFLSYYPWRPKSLAKLLVESVGLGEDAAGRVATYCGGSVERVLTALKYGGAVIRDDVTIGNPYHAVFNFEVHGKDSRWVPEQAKLSILYGVVRRLKFGQSIAGLEPYTAGLLYRDGKNYVSVGIDVYEFHRVTGWRYRFIIGADCRSCPFRSGCRLWFHPGRC